MNFKLKQRNLNEIFRDLNLQDKGKVQQYLDNTVVKKLQPYVSYKTGEQENSIKRETKAGEGKVIISAINPKNRAYSYSAYQAYSPRIKKRVGKRGTRPFERMKEAEKFNIEREVARYAKSISK